MDYAATTPLCEAASAAMHPFWQDKFGNPSSPHGFGQEAKAALEQARRSIGFVVDVPPHRIIFTSGATEANNLAIHSALWAKGRLEGHVVASAIEHPSVLESLKWWQRHGVTVTWIKPDPQGVIDPERIRNALTPHTRLVACLHASNEIGTIQTIGAIGDLLRQTDVLFLVDAVQTIGHEDVAITVWGADYVSCSAHKFYGPKGVGALFVSERAPVVPLLRGGDQEEGRRASTVNVPGVVGMAAALSWCLEQSRAANDRLRRMRDTLLDEIPRRIEGVRVNGHRTQRLSNNAHFAFEGVNAEALILALDMEGIAASMGSACHSGAMEPSHVLRAIGLPERYARGALRLSLGFETQDDDIAAVLDLLPRLIKRLRV